MPAITIYDQIRLGQLHVNIRSPARHRFWKAVDKNGPVHPIHGQCWNWTGTKMTQGYAVLTIHRKIVRAHRYSWVLHFGELGDGVDILHHCDRKSCTRPEHLFTGAGALNMADKTWKGRQAKGESTNHCKVTEQQVIWLLQNYTNEIDTSTANQLASDLGITRDSLRNILSGFRWRHVHEMLGLSITRPRPRKCDNLTY